MSVFAGALYGMAAMLLFRRLADGAAIRVSMNRMVAYALAFRLYLDEPRLVLRAQLDMFRENLCLLRAVALPSAILVCLFAPLYGPMDRVFGHRRLLTGESAVVTAPLTSGSMELKASRGVTVETPGVRILRTGRIAWRIRANRDGAAEPVVLAGGREAGPIEVTYPPAPWLGWFSLGSALGSAAMWSVLRT